jgi:DNA polymerase-3 subunit beta
MYIKNDEFAMTIRLIDGDYPDYRRVIPSQPRGKLSINVKRLVQGLRRAAIFTTDKNRGVGMAVSDEGLELNVEHPEFGRFEEKLEANYEGEHFTVIVNVNFFMEALHAIDSEEVGIEYYRDAGPLIFRPLPEANYFNLVMPMKA